MTPKVKSILRFLVWASLFVVPILILCALVIQKRTLLYFPLVGFADRAETLSRDWSRLSYVAIEDKEFPGKLEGTIGTVTNKSLLDDKQIVSLNLKLLQFFHAYSDGSYEKYKVFRMPKGVLFAWKSTTTIGSIDKWLVGLRVPPKIVLQLTPEKKFLAFLVAMNRNGTVYSNYFQGVSFENARIVVNLYSNVPPKCEKTVFFGDGLKNNLSDDVTFPNAGIWSEKDASFIHFDDDLDAVASRYSSVLVADSFFLIQRKKPLRVIPVVLRLYWHPTIEQWLPDDLVLGDMIIQERCWPVF
jgi:hypothetical protein